MSFDKPNGMPTLPPGWMWKTFDQVCDRISVGHVGETNSFFCGKEGVPFLRSQNVRPGRLDVNDIKYVTKDFHAKSKKSQLTAGDILIVRVGQNRGDCAVVPAGLGELNCANIVLAKPNRKYSNYIGYFFNSFLGREALLSLSSGSAQLVLNTKAIAKVVVPVPPEDVALSIGLFLKTIDDRIALLRETNATLEAIAQVLFKSWFVNFDRVHAKQDGRMPEGMVEATEALFPDSFEESELGQVPRGWRVQSLDEIATYLNGLALQKFPPTETSWLPVIKIAQLRKGDTVGADRAGRTIKSEYIVRDGDVLFSWSGSLEVAIWCGGEGALNQHLFKVTSDRFPKWFYYLWTKHHLENFRQIAASKATTMGHIQRGHLSQARVVVPPDEVIRVFDGLFGSLLERSISTILKAKNLAALRDTLLPRLISGQLRPQEAAEKLKEAA